MKKRIFYIGIFIVAVVGLFIVQYQYLKVGLSLAKVQFERKIENTGQELKNDLSQENQLSFLIARSFDNKKYFTLGQDSLQDASRHFLNVLIENRLNENRIESDFSYRLFSADSLINLRSPDEFEDEGTSIKYPVILEGYLPGALEKDLILQLEFQDLNTYFLSQLKGLLIPGLLFLAIIIFVVIWMLRLFFWQRDLITITNDFINNLTHELKTPVFSIGVAAKILEKDMDEKQKPILFQIRKQVSRLNKHIEQVLELASLESSEPVQLKKVDLGPHLEEWCKDFELQADMEKFRFRYELEPGRYMVKAGLFHFENAINNLLDNARKYSEDPEIILTAHTEQNRLIISITDNGKGISAREKRRIFKKFYRVPEGDLHKTKGYGLGLSYVKEIVKRHRGRIKVDSEPNKGTKITILIPLNE